MARETPPPNVESGKVNWLKAKSGWTGSWGIPATPQADVVIRLYTSERNTPTPWLSLWESCLRARRLRNGESVKLCNVL